MSTYAMMKAERLPDSLSDYLEDLDSDSLENLLGGFTSDSKLCWVASDAYLEVVRVKTARTVSRWNFGSVLRVTTSKIVSVDELKSSFNEVLMLVVGLEFLGTAGMVCIFDVYSMKIVRAIQIPEKVTFVHVIYNGNETTTFPGVLNSFDGALAVGTAGGNVYIVDLCREAVNEARQFTLTPKIKNEVDPCNLIILRPEDLHRIESLKEVADRKGNHLAIHLNALIGEQSPHFILKGPQGDTRVLVNKEEVSVSSLHFAPQLSSLLVGYNFGALQIWDLVSMDLVYTSPVCEENIPISHFAIQEPVDDPRAFCYFWAVYSYTEPRSDSFPVAALYSLCYESKEWHEGYGYIYQNLQSCNIRFQTDLAVGNIGDIKDPVGAQCLRLHSFSNHRNRDLGSSSIAEPYEDSYKLCSMAWNVWCKDRTSHVFLSVFDLNQWYKEQMPNVPHKEQSKKYMTTVCISDVSYKQCGHRFPAVDVHINPSTISPFKGAQKLEEHYYPESLSFDCSILTEYEICYMRNFGVQGKFYCNLAEDGPLALLKPSGLYENSVDIGLTPLFMEPLQVNHTNATHQREHILSIALENKMRNWLYKCAASWGNGSHRIAGLSLDLMLNWAWERAKVLKTNADAVCTTLFDYSGLILDQNARSILNKCRGQMLVIKDLYKYILTNCKQYLINPDITLKQYKCLERIYAYLDVLGWMYNVGLLPEHLPTRTEHGALVPYNLAELGKLYQERRAELRLLDGKKRLFDGDPILFIDKFMETCGSSALGVEWSWAGGGGCYPPSSLQALLRTYLVEDLEIQMKHVIVSYLFMDIADCLDPVEHKLTIANLLKFPLIFQINRSQLKLIQGFWHLDHNQLASAGELFIDPMLESRDLEPWHHRQILSTFMLQDANKLALLYLTFQKPPINDIDDVPTWIVVYVNNKMLHEAFTLHREHSRRGDTTLLNVIFREVLRTGQLKALIPMTLTRKEEEELLEFLDKLRYDERNEFKAVYFAIKGRYFDFRLHVKREKCPDGVFSLSNTCREILEKMVTAEDKKIVELCLEEKTNLLRSCKTPKPMSTFLYNKEENLKYKSNFLYACVAKSHEIWRDAAERESYFQNKNAKIRADDFPFLRSLTAPPFKQDYGSELIYPKIVDTFMEPPQAEEGEDGPSPTKRMKLSPRQAVHTPQTSKHDSAVRKLLTNFDTPVITASRRQTSVANEATPHSILKEHSVQREVHPQQVQLSTPQYIDTTDDHSASSIRKRIVLTPSKRRSVVRFIDVASANSSGSIAKDYSEEEKMDVNPLPSLTNTSVLPKSKLDVDDESTTESFYSPEVSSSNVDKNAEEETTEKRITTVIEKDNRIEENEDVRLSSKRLSVTDTSFTKKTTSTSVRESSVVKKTSMSLKERSFVEKSASIVGEGSFMKTRSASPFKAHKILEGIGESGVRIVKDVRGSVSETGVIKETISSTDHSSSSGAKRFDSPVPATLRSRKSYKGDIVKRVTRSSLFAQDDENLPEVIEEKEPHDDRCEEEPTASGEENRSKSPIMERYSSQKGRLSTLSEFDHVQRPLSRKSYREENVISQDQAHQSTINKIDEKTVPQRQEEHSDDELMEVISLSSRTTADTADTKCTDEDAAFVRAAGLEEDSDASNEDQNRAISIDEDSDAGGPEYSEEESDGGNKRRGVAGKIVFDTQEGDDCNQSRLAVTLDSLSCRSRLDFGSEDNGSVAGSKLERRSVVKETGDSEDSASLHGFDAGEDLSEDDAVVSRIGRSSTSERRLPSAVSARRSLTTVSGRKRRSQTTPQSVGRQSIISGKESETVFGRRPQGVGRQSIDSGREERIVSETLADFNRRLPIVSCRKSQVVSGRLEIVSGREERTISDFNRKPPSEEFVSDRKPRSEHQTIADSLTGLGRRASGFGREFSQKSSERQLQNIPALTSASKEPTENQSPVYGRTPQADFSGRSTTMVRRSIIAQAMTPLPSESICDPSPGTSSTESPDKSIVENPLQVSGRSLQSGFPGRSKTMVKRSIITQATTASTSDTSSGGSSSDGSVAENPSRVSGRSLQAGLPGRSRTMVKRSIIAHATTPAMMDLSEDSDSSEKKSDDERIETVSLSSKSDSAVSRKTDCEDPEESPKPRSRSGSKGRTSLRTSIFKLQCRKSLCSNSPKISDPRSDGQRRFSIGLNSGFIQCDSSDVSQTSERFEKNITLGDIASFSEDLKRDSSLDETGPYDSSGNVLEKNISSGDLETSSMEGNLHKITTKSADTAVQTTLLQRKLDGAEMEASIKETSDDRNETREMDLNRMETSEDEEDANLKETTEEDKGDVKLKETAEDQAGLDKKETAEGDVRKKEIAEDKRDAELKDTVEDQEDLNRKKTAEGDLHRKEIVQDKGDAELKETAEEQVGLHQKETGEGEDEDAGDGNLKEITDDQTNLSNKETGEDRADANRKGEVEGQVDVNIEEAIESREETTEDRGGLNKMGISEDQDLNLKETIGDEKKKETSEVQGDLIEMEMGEDQDVDPKETTEEQCDDDKIETSEAHICQIKTGKKQVQDKADRIDREKVGKVQDDADQKETIESREKMCEVQEAIESWVQDDATATSEDQENLNQTGTSAGRGQEETAEERRVTLKSQEQEGAKLDSEIGKHEESQISQEDVVIDSNVRKLGKSSDDNTTTVVTPRKLRKRDDTALLDSPARRTRSVASSGSSPLPTRTLRTRRCVSTDQPPESPKTPSRRKSFSVKESQTISSNRRASTSTEPGAATMSPVTRRTANRAKSVDAVLEDSPKPAAPKGRGKKLPLPAISEDRPMLEGYSESRRLTRRQKELFAKNLKGDGGDKKYDINLQSMDPIQLLDKEEFKGKADPDEQQLLQDSPAPSVISSTATDAGPTPNKKDLGHSSDDRSTSEVSLPKRNLRSSSKPKEDPSPIPAPVRRTRRASKDSVASDASDDAKLGVKKLKHTLSHISEDSQEDSQPKAKLKRGRPRKL